MLLWLQSFVSTGYFKDNKQALKVQGNIMLVSMILTFSLLPFIGKIADTAPSKYIIPVAYALRATACFCFT